MNIKHLRHQLHPGLCAAPAVSSTRAGARLVGLPSSLLLLSTQLQLLSLLLPLALLLFQTAPEILMMMIMMGSQGLWLHQGGKVLSHQHTSPAPSQMRWAAFVPMVLRPVQAGTLRCTVSYAVHTVPLYTADHLSVVDISHSCMSMSVFVLRC